MDPDEVHHVEEPKCVKLSLHLLVKRHLPPEASKWSHTRIVDALNKITHLRLDRENISYIDNLELLGQSVTNAYFQQNQIERIENLECLQNLRFLTLAGNKIREISGIAHLKKLGFLDLSENLIQTFDIDEFPQSLVILSLQGNPCVHISDYRGRIIQDLPMLRQLDGEPVTKTERREVGYIVSSDSEDEGEEEQITEKTSQAGESTMQTMTASILQRSQSRMEEAYAKHKQRIDDLENIRGESSLPASTARPYRSKSPWMGDLRVPSPNSRSHPGSRLGAKGSPLGPIK